MVQYSKDIPTGSAKGSWNLFLHRLVNLNSTDYPEAAYRKTDIDWAKYVDVISTVKLARAPPIGAIRNISSGCIPEANLRGILTVLLAVMVFTASRNRGPSSDEREGYAITYVGGSASPSA